MLLVDVPLPHRASGLVQYMFCDRNFLRHAHPPLPGGHKADQDDPTFRTTRLYCRLTAPEVRRQLIRRKSYTDEQLPSLQTITTKLNALGYHLGKVRKCLSKKKSPKRTPSSRN